MEILGIDVGGTTIKAALVSDTGEIRQASKVTIPTVDERDAVINTIVDLVAQFPTAEKVGVSFPGVIQGKGYLRTAGALRSMFKIDLYAELTQRITKPLAILNDANAATLAEQAVGDAKDVDNYILFALGTGVGGGLVINGQLYAGKHGMAGEFGFQSMNPYHETNEMDYSLSFEGSLVFGLIRNYELATGRNVNRDAKQVFEAAEAGDAVAASVVERFYLSLAHGILNAVMMIDPELILIAGGVTNRSTFLEVLLTTLDTVMSDLSRYQDIELPPIKLAKMKADAGIVGAAQYAKTTL